MDKIYDPQGRPAERLVSLRGYYFCKVLMFIAYALPWRMLVNAVSLLPREKEPERPTIITAFMWGPGLWACAVSFTNEQKWPQLY